MTRLGRLLGLVAGVALCASAAAALAPVASGSDVQVVARQTQAPVQPAMPARPPRQGYEVVATYPHDANAFTQGLVFDRGELVESTGRHPSTVRRVRLADGVVLKTRELDMRLFGEGLAVVGDWIISLTWQDGEGFVWDRDTLEPRGGFTYAGEGWGLAYDGTRLILSDGTPTLRFLDPGTFAEIGRVTVNWQGRAVGRLNELEYVDGEILANVWQTDVIVRIDPANGAIRGVIDLTGLLPKGTVADPTDDVLNGIAWDAAGRRLFVTGKKWPSLFEIRLTPPG